MRSRPLVLSNLLAACCIAGCATLPDAEPTPLVTSDYQIPVVKANGAIETFTVEPDGSSERMLFCVEGETTVVCIAEDGGVAHRYVMPMAPQKPVGPGA